MISQLVRFSHELVINWVRVKIDNEWFEARICEKYGSLNRFARLMRGRNGKPMTQSAFWRRLNGDFEFRLDEVAQLAKLLDVHVMEIIRRLGVQD